MKTLKSVLILAIAITSLNAMGQEKLKSTDQNMYVIEREIPGAGKLTAEELQSISQTSCSVLDEMGADNIKWLHSYVTGDKIYCVYQAKNEDLVREHAQKGGFPANSVAEVKNVISPATAKKN